MATQYLALPANAQLSDADGAAMTDLYRRGMPPNCLAQCKGSAGGQFHDQQIGQRLQKAVVFLLGLVTDNRLTASGDGVARCRGGRGLPA
jgi:hypothetical protein